MNRRQKFLLLIPIISIAGLLIYTWIVLFQPTRIPTWRHYLALGLFIPILSASFKGYTTAVIVTGVYLLLATFNVIVLTPDITTNYLRVGIFKTPEFQLVAFVLFILYSVLNLDTLIDIYLDLKGVQKSRREL